MRKKWAMIGCLVFFLSGCAGVASDAGSEIYEAVPQLNGECVSDDDTAGCVTDCSASVTYAFDATGTVAENDRSFECYDSRSMMPRNESVDTVAAIEEDPLVMLTFLPYSDTLIMDGEKLFTATCYLPQFYSDDPSLNDWIEWITHQYTAQSEQMLAQTRGSAEEVYQTVRESGTAFYPYSFYSNLYVERMDVQFASILQVNSVYSVGAHPTYTQTAYNLNLQSQEELTLTDILVPSGKETLLEMILQELETQSTTWNDLGLYDILQQTVLNTFSTATLTPDWYLTTDGLIIYFNCYEIAPYAAGIIKLTFPYEVLNGVLRSEFFPEERVTDASSGGNTLVQLSSETGERQVLHATDTGTDPVFIETFETIFDVRLYLLRNWITDDTPSIGQVLFAANRLTSDEVIAVAGEMESDTRPQYLLAYRTETGEQVCLAIVQKTLRPVKTVISE